VTPTQAAVSAGAAAANNLNISNRNMRHHETAEAGTTRAGHQRATRQSTWRLCHFVLFSRKRVGEAAKRRRKAFEKVG
jgi:hypothetical protein